MCIAVAVLSPVWSTALSVVTPAQAQSADAGGTLPAEPADPAGSSPAESEADPHAAAAPPGEQVPPGLKALSPSQRLPENLQGWMRERQRRNPALIERQAPTGSALVPQQDSDDPTVEGLKRRLRSFDEGGVTVLSNRRLEPVAPALTRVASAAAVSRPAPQPQAVAEAEPEEAFEPAGGAASVATRSLRPQSSRREAQDATPQWPAWLALSAALGLGVVWLRKRRAVS